MQRSRTRCTAPAPTRRSPWALPLAVATFALCSATALQAQVAEYNLSYDKLLKTESILQIDEDAAFEPITGGTVLADGQAAAVAGGTAYGVGYSEYEEVGGFFGSTYRPKGWLGNATFVGNTGAGDGGNSDAEYQITGTALKTGPGYPIGFDFTFNGETFDRVGISGQGWISFGNSSNGSTAVAAYTAQAASANNNPLSETLFLQNDSRRNRVVATGVTGGGYNVGTTIMPIVHNPAYSAYPGAELRYETIGTAPNRVFVVQWLRYGFTISSFDQQYYRQMDFQVRLYEGSNNVEVRFGKAWRSNTVAQFQTGLAGKTGGNGPSGDFSSFGFYDATANAWRNWPYGWTSQANHNGYPGSTEFGQRIAWDGPQGYSPYNSYGSNGSAEEFYDALFTPLHSNAGTGPNGQNFAQANRVIQGGKANTPDMMSFVWETPACAMEHSNLTANAGMTSVTLNWDGTGDFIWAVDLGSDPEAAAFTGSTSGNTATVTGLQASSTYNAWVSTECSGGGQTMWSKVIFNTLPCVPPSYTYAYTISEVTIADISNTSPVGASSNSTDLTYEDFTSITGHMTTDEDYPFTVVAQSPYGAYLYFFFDWDQDGIFEDRQRFGPFGAGSPATFTGTVHVPGSANAGLTRMRVVQEYDGYNIPTGCEAVNYGQYEDYTIEVALNSCPSPKSLVVSNIDVHSADFSWTVAPLTPDNGYDWEVLDSDNNVVASDNTSGTTASVASGLITNTTYTFRVRSACTGEESSWQSTTFTTLLGCGAEWESPGDDNYMLTSTQFVETWTLCPENPGDVVTLDFTYWGGLNWNIAQASRLFIFDGDDENAPMVPGGNGTAYTNGAWTVPAGGWTDTYTNNNDNKPPTVTANSVSGCLTVKVYSYGSWTTSGQGWIADILCAPRPTCFAPTDRVVDNLTPHTADLSWDAGDSPNVEWVVVAKGDDPSDSQNWVDQGTSSTGSATATGLDAWTEYQAYMRGLCDDQAVGDDPSVWSDPALNFRTELGCGAEWELYYSTSYYTYPANIDTVNVICPDNVGDVVTVEPTHFKFGGSDQGAVSVYFFDGNSTSAPMWHSGMPQKTYVGNVLPAGGYRGTTYDNVLPGPFTSTDASGCITVRLLSFSGYTYDTGMKANITCAPAPACSTPTLVNFSNVGGTDAMVSWSNTSGPCIVEYGPAGFTPGTDGNAGTNGTIASSTATPPFLMTGLSTTTTYDVYVRQVCDGPSYSANSWFTKVTTSMDCSTATVISCGVFNDDEDAPEAYATGNAAYNGDKYTNAASCLSSAAEGNGPERLYRFTVTEAGMHAILAKKSDMGSSSQVSYVMASVEDGCAASAFTCIGKVASNAEGTLTFSATPGDYYLMSDANYSVHKRPFTLACPGIPMCVEAPAYPKNGSIIAVNSTPIAFSWPAVFGATGYDIYFMGSQVASNHPDNFITDGSYTSANMALMFGLNTDISWHVVPRNSYGTADCPIDWTFRVGGNNATYAVNLTEGELTNGNNFTENGYTNQYSTYWGEDFWAQFTTSACADSASIEICVPTTSSVTMYITVLKASDNSVVSQFNSSHSAAQPCSMFPRAFDYDWYYDNDYGSTPGYEDRYIIGFPVDAEESYYVIVDRYGVGYEFNLTYHEMVDGTDSDEDGIPDCMDSCPEIAGAEGDPCTPDGGGAGMIIDCDCVAGNHVVVSITTDNNPEETFWELTDEWGSPLASGAPTQANATVSETVFLPGNDYGFRVYDDAGDGITNGGWELRTTDGRLILRDSYDVAAATSPIDPPHTASYGDAHYFSLPLGAVDIHPDECGIWDNQPDNKVYAVKQAGKNYQGGTLNYQFEFINPDSGRVRRTKKDRNYVLWSELTNPDLVAGVKYFAHVRTDKFGPITEANYGAGCEMSLAAPTVCTGLIDESTNQYYSCNVERRFRPNSQIYAWPVYGATKYKFRVYNLGEGYDQEFISNNYKLELSWPVEVAPKLRNGYTYQVQVSAQVNGVWTNYCAACPVTINNNPSGHMVEVFGDATLWPNPARDGQVNLNIDGIASDVQHITVDVKDIYGQHVYGQEFENMGDRFNTVLDLPGDIATGIYMVNITVNGEVTTKRLSIVR